MYIVLSIKLFNKGVLETLISDAINFISNFDKDFILFLFLFISFISIGAIIQKSDKNTKTKKYYIDVLVVIFFTLFIILIFLTADGQMWHSRF